MLNRFSLREEDVRRGKVIGLDKAVREAGEAKLAAELGVGIPTLRDIVAELSKPGRDARDDLPAPILRTDVLTLDDLSEGMELTGTVRNVVDFGAIRRYRCSSGRACPYQSDIEEAHCASE